MENILFCTPLCYATFRLKSTVWVVIFEGLKFCVIVGINFIGVVFHVRMYYFDYQRSPYV